MCDENLEVMRETMDNLRVDTLRDGTEMSNARIVIGNPKAYDGQEYKELTTEIINTLYGRINELITSHNILLSVVTDLREAVVKLKKATGIVEEEKC